MTRSCEMTIGSFWNIPGPNADDMQAPATRRFELTDMQRAYYLGGMDAHARGDRATHVYLELELGSYSLADAREALDAVLSEHEVFGMRLVDDEDGLAQLYDHAGQLEAVRAGAGVRLIDRAETGLDKDSLDQERRRLFALEFDATRLPRYAATLVHGTDGEITLLFACDGMLMDGQAINLFARELDRRLRACADGTGEPAQPGFVEVGEVDPSFTGYLDARRAVETEYASLGTADEDLAFWCDLVEGHLALPRLMREDEPSSPSSDDPLQVPTYQVRETITPSDWLGFCACAQRADLMPFPLVLTIFGHAVGRYGACDRFLVNIPQRPPIMASLPPVIGMTSSFFPFPFEVGDDAILSQADRNMTTLFEMQDHAGLHGPTLLAALSRKTGTLVEAPVVLTLVTRGQSGPKGGVAVDHMRIHTSETLLEATLFERADGSVDVCVSARTRDVPYRAAQGIAQMLASAIRGFAGGTLDARTVELPLGVEAAAIVSSVNDRCDEDFARAAMGLPPLSRQLADSFARNAAREAIAGDCGSISYERLSARCHHLIARMRASFPELECTTLAGPYVRAELLDSVSRHHSTVAILLPKGARQVMAIAACVLGSISFMPVNPHLPVRTIKAAFANAGVRHVLACAETMPLVGELSLRPEQVLSIDESFSFEGDAEADDETLRHLDEYTAHLLCMNTSGSTGVPKTISINDWALASCFDYAAREYGFDEDTCAIALTNIGHDLALFDSLAPFAYGGRVVTLSDEQRREPREWLRAIRENGVNTWNSVPAFMQMFSELDDDELAGVAGTLGTCVFSGDFLSVALCRRIHAALPATRVVNSGGPAETTVWNVFHKVTERDLAGDELPYGRPFAGTGYWILDAHGWLCPPGVAGVMHASGICLSNGYLREDGLVRDGFTSYAGREVYSTGDVGFYGQDCEIHIRGREDGQVKINGKRIELSAIENVLLEDRSIHQAVVVLAKRDRRMVAYLVCDDPVDETELRARLGDALPTYMIPAVFVRLDAMPLTANDKVDRKSLSARDVEPTLPGGGASFDDAAGGAGAGPAESRRTAVSGTSGQSHDDLADHGRDEVTQELEEVLCEVFGRPVSLGDNYYVVGGDSLRAMRIVSMVRRRLGVELAVYDLLGKPEISSWVDMIAERRQGAGRQGVVSHEEAMRAVIEVLGRYLAPERINSSGDFLAMGGDASLAGIVASDLASEFGASASRYDLLFTPRIAGWPALMGASS